MRSTSSALTRDNPMGRYSVRLPLSSSLSDLSETRRLASRLLKQIEIKFVRDPLFYSLYTNFMHQYAKLQHMTMVPPFTDTTPPVQVCYLPHHSVMRDSSSTTRLREVFNDSTAVPKERLNRYLMTGYLMT